MFILIFYADCVDWVLIIFGTQVKKNDRFGRCFQTIFPFLMTIIKNNNHSNISNNNGNHNKTQLLRARRKKDQRH